MTPRDKALETGAGDDAWRSMAISLKKIARHLGWISFAAFAIAGAIIGHTK